MIQDDTKTRRDNLFDNRKSNLLNFLRRFFQRKTTEREREREAGASRRCKSVSKGIVASAVWPLLFLLIYALGHGVIVSLREEGEEEEEEDSLALMRRREASMDPRVSPLLSLFPFASQLLHPFCLFQQSGIQNGFQPRCFNCPFRSNSIDAIGAIPGSIAFLESEKGFP